MIGLDCKAYGSHVGSLLNHKVHAHRLCCPASTEKHFRGRRERPPNHSSSLVSSRGSFNNLGKLAAVPASEGEPTDPAADSSGILTLPTILTLSRVAAIPALIAAGIFLAACITDFLDGYLARKMGTHSPFGAFLDPVADKLMVSTVLILLSSKPFTSGSLAGNTWLMPTIASAIIGREIAMSALREWAASLGEEAHKAVAVSKLGKWKTTTQMASLTLLLVSSGASQGNTYLDVCATVGAPLLLIAAFLTLFSLYEYFRGLWKYLV